MKAANEEEVDQKTVDQLLAEDDDDEEEEENKEHQPQTDLVQEEAKQESFQDTNGEAYIQAL